MCQHKFKQQNYLKLNISSESHFKFALPLNTANYFSHSKIYLFKKNNEKDILIVTSANFSKNGMQDKGGNYEFGVQIQLDSNDSNYNENQSIELNNVRTEILNEFTSQLNFDNKKLTNKFIKLSLISFLEQKNKINDDIFYLLNKIKGGNKR
jgi:hypothetical protein